MYSFNYGNEINAGSIPTSKPICSVLDIYPSKIHPIWAMKYTAVQVEVSLTHFPLGWRPEWKRWVNLRYLTFTTNLLARCGACESTGSEHSVRIRMESIHSNVCSVAGSEAEGRLCFCGCLNLPCFRLFLRFAGQNGRNWKWRSLTLRRTWWRVVWI